MLLFRLAILICALILLLAAPSHAACCGGDFNSFVAAMSQEAAAAGVSQAVIGQAFAGITEELRPSNNDAGESSVV